MMLELPPWSSPQSWQQVRESFAAACKNNSADNTEMISLAGRIAAKYQHLGAALNGLCGQTCTTCLEVCCRHATVWYDFTDLLFQYINVGDIPSSQIQRSKECGCDKLSANGCVLRRVERPFICSWYICHKQMALLDQEGLDGVSRSVLQDLKDIKILRKKMEDSFVSLTAD